MVKLFLNNVNSKMAKTYDGIPIFGLYPSYSKGKLY